MTMPMTMKDKISEEIETGSCHCHKWSGHRQGHKRSGHS